MIEKKYGVPWIKVNFIGAEATAKSLRKIAEYFEDKELMDQVERVISEEMEAVLSARKEIYPGVKESGPCCSSVVRAPITTKSYSARSG